MPTFQLPASASTSTSERSSSRCASRNAWSVGEPISSSPSIEHAHVARQLARRFAATRRPRARARRRPPCRRRCRDRRDGRRVPRVRTDRWPSSRRCRAAARRGARTAGRSGASGPACIHSPSTYGCDPSTPVTRTFSRPCERRSSAVCSALARTSAKWSGSALMLGMRTSASSSAARGVVRGIGGSHCVSHGAVVHQNEMSSGLY